MVPKDVAMEGIEDDDCSLQDLEDLYVQTSVPLYPDSKTSLISAVVVILMLCSTYNMTNAFADEL